MRERARSASPIRKPHRDVAFADENFVAVFEQQAGDGIEELNSEKLYWP
jgi:hypothetical protein